MATITLEIPDEVTNFIKNELKVEPQTYLQNEAIDPILAKYKIYLSTKMVAEAKTQVDKDVARAKTTMKVKLNGVK